MRESAAAVVANRLAATVSARVFLLSRGLIFLSAATAFALFGADPANSDRYGDSPFAAPFGGLGEALLSVWSRWDSVWYLGIANAGYDFNPDSPAFFPLYPMLSRGLADLGGLASPAPGGILVAGLAVSLVAFAAALYVFYRLVELEVDAPTAALAVALLGFFPMAVFYGAIYSESLFLLASVAAVWFARTERWAAAGLCGAAAAATRSVGIVIALPILLIYLLGPRGRGAQARPYLGLPWRREGSRRAYPLRRDALWILLVPLGTIAYLVYLWIATGDPWRFGDAQALWGREFGHLGPVPLGPIAGLATGIWEGLIGAGQILIGTGGSTVWSPDDAQSLRGAGVNLEALLFLVLAIAATIGVLRRLPLAYGAYAVALLLFPLSFPREGLPLFSMPRFVAVVFPIFIWLAIWLREREWERPALALSAALLALYSAQWATWQWVS